MWRGMGAVLLLLTQDPQRVATAVEGTALDSMTRLPLIGAQISLAPAETADDQVTGGAGGFRFAGIAPGRYRIVARYEGYREAGRFFELKTGSSQEKITLLLTPLSSIGGRVLDENGQGVPDVHVETGANRNTTTDAAGRYEFRDLSPGDYRLVFMPQPGFRQQSLLRDGKTGEVFGYADRVYYPGSDDPRMSVPVTVAAKVEMQGIDIKLKRTRLVEISGRLLDKGSGEALRDAEIELTTAGPDDDRTGPTIASKRSGADGSFRFEWIQAGSYWALIRRGDGADYPYRMPLDVGQHGISGAELRIPPYVSLAVHAVWPGSEPAMGTLNIAAAGSGSLGRCQIGDACVIRGAPPGRIRLRINAIGFTRQPPRATNYYIKSIRFGQQDGANAAITVAEGANPPIEITFTDKAGGMAATVLNEDGQDAESAAIEVSRADGDLSIPHGGPYVFHSYSPFLVGGLLPGDYWVAAFPARDDQTPIRTVAPERCGDRAARVKVTEGHTAAVTLRPCVAPN